MKHLCSPVTRYTNGSCFTKQQLVLIAEKYNEFIKNKKRICKYKPDVINGGNSEEIESCIKETEPIKDIYRLNKQELVKKLQRRFYKVCKDEQSCWLNFDFIDFIKDDYIKEHLLKYTFKPQKTKYSTKHIKTETEKLKDIWLSSIDIDNVLEQYELKYDDFLFYGAFPCDFYKITTIDYSDFKKYKTVAFVLNLDENDKPGSHWVSLLVDNKNKTIEYFDSAGRPPKTTIKIFIDILHEFFKSKYEILINDVKHQLGNSECGVYSIYFILNRISGKNFYDITENEIPDRVMESYRQEIFYNR